VSFERDWLTIARMLPANWWEARLAVELDHPDEGERAAALLAPAHPLRRDTIIRLHVQRDGGVTAEAVARILARLDKEHIAGTVELEHVSEQERAEDDPQPSLARAWAVALTTLPPDWSDLMAEVALTSTDHLERAALLMSPTQPSRDGRAPTLRFRAARRFGYGVSPEMARRCLTRLDDEEIPGELHLLWGLSDTHNVATQGPVWRVDGRAV